MRFRHWLKNTVIISRMTTVSGNKIALTTVTGCSGHIQPLSAERSSLVGGVYGKTYMIWVESTIDIEDGDLLRDENSVKYKVKKGGVTHRNFGSFDYKQVLIEKTV